MLHAMLNAYNCSWWGLQRLYSGVASSRASRPLLLAPGCLHANMTLNRTTNKGKTVSLCSEDTTTPTGSLACVRACSYRLLLLLKLAITAGASSSHFASRLCTTS